MVLHKILINMSLDCFNILKKCAVQITLALNQGQLDVTSCHILTQ